MLPALASSNRGEWWGGQAPTWLLEGQAPVAGILLELDLLQGEEGGGCGQRGHRPGDGSVNRSRSCSLWPLAYHARGAGGTPSVGAGSPRTTGFAPLVTKENPAGGPRMLSQTRALGSGLCSLLPQTHCPTPGSREVPPASPSHSLSSSWCTRSPRDRK